MEETSLFSAGGSGLAKHLLSSVNFVREEGSWVHEEISEFDSDDELLKVHWLYDHTSRRNYYVQSLDRPKANYDVPRHPVHNKMVMWRVLICFRTASGDRM